MAAVLALVLGAAAFVVLRGGDDTTVRVGLTATTRGNGLPGIVEVTRRGDREILVRSQ